MFMCRPERQQRQRQPEIPRAGSEIITASEYRIQVVKARRDKQFNRRAVNRCRRIFRLVRRNRFRQEALLRRL